MTRRSSVRGLAGFRVGARFILYSISSFIFIYLDSSLLCLLYLYMRYLFFCFFVLGLLTCGIGEEVPYTYYHRFERPQKTFITSLDIAQTPTMDKLMNITVKGIDFKRSQFLVNPCNKTFGILFCTVPYSYPSVIQFDLTGTMDCDTHHFWQTFTYNTQFLLKAKWFEEYQPGQYEVLLYVFRSDRKRTLYKDYIQIGTMHFFTEIKKEAEPVPQMHSAIVIS